MERENSSNNCNSKPRRYVPPSYEGERENGIPNNEDSENDDDDVAGEYLEVKNIALVFAGVLKT